MSSLSHRSCVGRRVSNTVDHFIRFNSNKASPNSATQSPANEPSPEPPAPPTPAAEASSNSPAIPKSRIASSWNNITIPTREEILQKPRNFLPGHDQGHFYKPDLSYLKRGSPTSFASRLAAETAPTESVTAKPTAGLSPTPRLTKAEEKQIKDKERRIAEATAQRREERLAREAAQKAKAAAASLKPRPSAKSAPRQTGAYDGIDTALHKVQRRGTQPGQRGQERSRGAPASRGAQGRMRTSNSTGPTKTPRPEIDLSASSEDITLEILEQGGDDKAPAEFRDPDMPSTNLDEVFGPSPEKRLENATRAESTFTTDQVQWLREVYGGDYLRFAPPTGTDCITPPRKLGPLKHAQLVLAKRRDVTIGARKDALAVISSAVSKGDVS